MAALGLETRHMPTLGFGSIDGALLVVAGGGSTDGVLLVIPEGGSILGVLLVQVDGSIGGNLGLDRFACPRKPILR